MAGLFQRLIARTGASVPFTIHGEPVEAQQGDLLLTAILLHRPAPGGSSSAKGIAPASA